LNRKEKRYARVCALKMSYAYEMVKNKDTLKDIDFDDNEFKNMENINEYAMKLTNKCLDSNKELDDLIISKSSNWDISRIAIIDLIIIRLALTEMLYFEDIPAKVSIVEAVEISKEYSTDASSGFINGILDSIYNKNEKIV
tara:strand:- start:2401 stop:2823 length:423 start_codon:yes stop_codon:yes gene_type:complete